MSTSGEVAAPKPSSLARVGFATGFGTLVEWYDFFIFGTAAALVFPQLFFPDFDPLTGVLLSFATFAGGFVIRPLGAAFFGHYGDRLGRKKILIVTLLLMGGATVTMGLLPTYEQWGPWATIILVILRLLQGFAVSGEYGGAVLMALEHAPEHRRGLYGTFPQVATPVALALSSTVFLVLTSTLDDAQFESWGWRVPFLLSAVLVVLGWWIRVGVNESPEFEKVKATEDVARAPLMDALRNHRRAFVLVALAYPAAGTAFYIISTFCINYGVGVGLTRSSMLAILLMSAAIMLVVMPIGAAASDHLGRKPIYITGLLAITVGAIPLFLLLNTGSTALAALGFVVPTIGFSLSWSVVGTFFGESFDPRVRYSGLAMSYTIGTILGSSTAPLVAAWLYKQTSSGALIGIYMIAWVAISLSATLKMKETLVRTSDHTRADPSAVPRA